MRQARKQRGFTIVETMIVLAVTGLMFLLAVVAINGKQNQAEFNQAVNDIRSQIQQEIDQVGAGDYPDTSNFQCSPSGNTLSITAGAKAQGSNEGCVFLGKVMQFGVRGTSPEAFRVYNIAGLQNATAGSTSPFQNAYPTVVGVNNNYSNYSVAGMLHYGLTTAWVRSDKNITCKAASCSLGAVGFLDELGAINAQGTGYINGTQPLDLVPLRGTTLGQYVDGNPSAATSINSALRKNNLTAYGPINPTNGVQICFASGGTNQSALITIGNGGRDLSVDLRIKDGRSC